VLIAKNGGRGSLQEGTWFILIRNPDGALQSELPLHVRADRSPHSTFSSV
jgi:hypothetical protein